MVVAAVVLVRRRSRIISTYICLFHYYFHLRLAPTWRYRGAVEPCACVFFSRWAGRWCIATPCTFDISNRLSHRVLSVSVPFEGVLFVFVIVGLSLSFFFPFFSRRLFYFVGAARCELYTCAVCKGDTFLCRYAVCVLLWNGII